MSRVYEVPHCLQEERYHALMQYFEAVDSLAKDQHRVMSLDPSSDEWRKHPPHLVKLWITAAYIAFIDVLEVVGEYQAHIEMDLYNKTCRMNRAGWDCWKNAMRHKLEETEVLAARYSYGDLEHTCKLTCCKGDFAKPALAGDELFYPASELNDFCATEPFTLCGGDAPSTYPDPLPHQRSPVVVEARNTRVPLPWSDIKSMLLEVDVYVRALQIHASKPEFNLSSDDAAEIRVVVAQNLQLHTLLKFFGALEIHSATRKYRLRHEQYDWSCECLLHPEKKIRLCAMRCVEVAAKWLKTSVAQILVAHRDGNARR